MITKDELLKILNKQTKIDESSNCWIWNGAKTGFGYGYIRINNKIYTIHRLITHFFHNLNLENINELACHKAECKHLSCWNPDHLYKGTKSSNAIDRFNSGKINYNEAKTHCKNGHEFTSENTIILKNLARKCRICRTKYNKEYREKYVKNKPVYMSGKLKING